MWMGAMAATCVAHPSPLCSKSFLNGAMPDTESVVGGVGTRGTVMKDCCPAPGNIRAHKNPASLERQMRSKIRC